MVFLMDKKTAAIWECPNCGRLLLRPKHTTVGGFAVVWYVPEAGLKPGAYRPNYAKPEQYLTLEQV